MIENIDPDIFIPEIVHQTEQCNFPYVLNKGINFILCLIL